jgi:VanZ family protein
MLLAALERIRYISSPMVKFDRKLLLYRLPPFIYAALILSISAWSTAPVPDLGIASADKIYHFIEYFILGILICRAVGDFLDRSPRWWRILLVSSAGLGFAAFDEIVQYFVPYRDASPWDWSADALGYLIAVALYLTWVRLRRRSADNV